MALSDLEKRQRNIPRIRYFGMACVFLAGLACYTLYIWKSVVVVIPLVALSSGAIVSFTSIWLTELEARLTQRD